MLLKAYPRTIGDRPNFARRAPSGGWSRAKWDCPPLRRWFSDRLYVALPSWSANGVVLQAPLRGKFLTRGGHFLFANMPARRPPVPPEPWAPRKYLRPRIGPPPRCSASPPRRENGPHPPRYNLPITPSRTASRRATVAPELSAPSMKPTNFRQACSPAKCSRPSPPARIGPSRITCPGAGVE